MANNKSNYLENKLIDHVMRGVAFTTPGVNIFVALYTAAPGEAGGGTEVIGGAYARKQVSGSGGDGFRCCSELRRSERVIWYGHTGCGRGNPRTAF